MVLLSRLSLLPAEEFKSSKKCSKSAYVPVEHVSVLACQIYVCVSDICLRVSVSDICSRVGVSDICLRVGVSDICLRVGVSDIC